MIVLDTSALIFWTLDPDQLSAVAEREINQSDRILISSISIWEIGLKAKREKLVLPMTIQDFTTRLEQLERIEILPVDVQTWLDNLELDWENRDPVDRTIVVLARHHGCPLVSSDTSILGYYPKAIW